MIMRPGYCQPPGTKPNPPRKSRPMAGRLMSGPAGKGGWKHEAMRFPGKDQGSGHVAQGSNLNSVSCA